MKPLNPFLRAFFASKLPSQCIPPENHILLVPTTEFLLRHKDGESQSSYSDLVTSEDFLASHILRLQDGFPLGPNGHASSSSKDSKTKARQYTTVNGKSVIVKDTAMYANKGFKSLVQSQLLYDEIYHVIGAEISQWLLYYISKPLLGIPEPIDPHRISAGNTESSAATKGTADSAAASGSQAATHLSSFTELLNHFPQIARQLQPGLEKSFRQFEHDADQGAPPDGSDASTRRSSDASLSTLSKKSILNPSTSLPAEAAKLRSSLETLVLSSIELFQGLDKQQLTLIGSVTHLSGQAVDNMIERYVTEQVHDRILFPRLCATTAVEDDALQRSIKQMVDIDISQVGIVVDDEQESKSAYLDRLSRGVEIFKKIANAHSPQEMLDILLQTERCLTAASNASEAQDAEKNALASSNADTLVSLFLVVVIRSSVHHLQARFAYMRDFILLTDVESGEIGYALSTFEAVLTYLMHSSTNLCKISKANRHLWQAIRKGDLAAVKSVIEKDSEALYDDSEPSDAVAFQLSNGASSTQNVAPEVHSQSPVPRLLNGTGEGSHSQLDNPAATALEVSDTGDLTHVFPFPRPPPPPSPKLTQVKLKKRVSLDMRSMSSSSAKSFSTMASTIGSGLGMTSGETSVEQLCRTQDSNGNSLLMMAVQNSHVDVLAYLLSMPHLFSIQRLLIDTNFEGTSLLNAAFQIGQKRIVNILLDYIFHHTESDDRIRQYFRLQDSNGRSAAHYLFNVPDLIEEMSWVIPWSLKDNNGQTPLFALCRSYDHDDYRGMMQTGLQAALQSTRPLNLDDMADNKRNTLLHIVTDSEVLRSLLRKCEANPNTANEKGFTPLMVASKFARVDAVRTLFSDPRIDLQARDQRGLTAVEVAKDDEVRNRIDDLVLLAAPAAVDGRKTTIARAILVDDWIVRMVIKSGAPNTGNTMTVTTCRRSTIEFKLLAGWLALEHPASWMPNITYRSPFQIPTKPSRQVSRDIQLRFDGFLRTLLTHPTFSTHEMVWEFFLVPEMDAVLLDERANRKSQVRAERILDEYEPLYDSIEVEAFVDFARSQVTAVDRACRAVLGQVNASRHVYSDLAEANRISSNEVSECPFISETQRTGFHRYANAVHSPAASPLTQLHYTLLNSVINTAALRTAFKRPGMLITQMNATREELRRHEASATLTQRWPSALGLLDDARARLQQESHDKAQVARRELHRLGCELRYTQQTVASELAGWQDTHASSLAEGFRAYAKKTLVVERARLQGLQAALRVVRRTNGVS